MTVINGKEVDLRLDFGAVRLFNKETGKNMLALGGSEWQDPDIIAMLLMTCAKRGKSELSEEDIDNTTLPELFEIVQGLTKNFAPEAQEGDVPNAAGQN